MAARICTMMPDNTVEQVDSVVRALSTEVGTGPLIGSLWDSSPLRRRPIIQLPDNRRLWARPVDFADVALDWAYEACAGDRPMLRLFDRERQKGVEDLTEEALLQVFGENRVRRNVR